MELLFKPFPKLETERLVLRKLVDSDKKAIFDIRSNKEVNKFIDRHAPENISDIETFIRMIDQLINTNKGIYWVIEHNNTLIGSIGLRHFNHDFSYAEIGYELHLDFHKKGFMSESLQKVIHFGFSKLNLKAIEAFTHKNNESSIALLNKNNFIYQPKRRDKGFENNRIFRIENN